MDTIDQPSAGAPASSPTAPQRSPLQAALIALAVGAGLFLAWQTAGTLLLIFAGLLFGALLDACTRGLAAVVPIGRAWRLAIVCLFLTLATAWLLVWSGANLVGQADSLIQLIGEQLRILRGELRSIGIAPPPSATEWDGVDYNLAFIGPDFMMVRDRPFDPFYMRPLYEHGRQRALRGDAWVKQPPI